MRRWFLPAILVLAAVATSGCDSGGGNPTAIQTLWEPAVPGIYLRDESGDVLGRYGDPIDGGLLAFPVPSNGPIRISFRLENMRPVEIVVLAAGGPGDPPVAAREANIAGGAVLAPAGTVVRHVVSEMIEAGPHSIIWDGRDDAGERVPSSYYRVVMDTGDGVSFTDVFYVNPDAFWMPPGLAELVMP